MPEITTAAELDLFNENIVGLIELVAEYRGTSDKKR